MQLAATRRPVLAAVHRIKPGEMEVGLGIHGEPGYLRQAWQPARELVPSMLQRVLGYGGLPLASRPEDAVALMVGGALACL
jgi:dihydroxyacetone kinase